MIKCNNIYKIYNNDIIIENFEYEFQNTGFYLLFGESGSGKTTFLNILSGLLPYEKGQISIDDVEFEHCINKDFMADKSDYITQDAFFIDFLTVADNLKMINDNEEYVAKMLDKFGLLSKLQEYPAKLSGGEKQRLALVRSLVRGKKILLLDEPTASLDMDNKLQIFEMLSRIKDEVLIICSSHDRMAMDYADEIIRFEKKHNKCSDAEKNDVTQTGDRHNKNIEISRENKKTKAFYFLNKWFSSKYKSKVSTILFGLFLTIAMSMCLLADDPQKKIDTNIEYLYKVNMCSLVTHEEEPGEYDRLCNIDGIEDVVIEYGLSVPTGEIAEDGFTIINSGTYEVYMPVLPSDKDAFKLSDKIKYGSYFTGENQIILSPEMAEKLMGSSQEKLIGETIEKEFYGIGTVELEIVGIFDYFNEFEKEYMKALGVSIADGEYYNKLDYESLWYINSDFMKQYADNEEFYNDGQRGYALYFDSYSSMKEYYNENYQFYRDRGDSLLMGLQNGKLLGLFDLLYMVFRPLSICIALFSVIFYITLIKTELTYNNKFISVMDYSGYKTKKVINTFIILNWLHLLKICSISVIIALCITRLANAVNERIILFEFRIFSEDIKMLLVFAGALLVVSIVFIYAFLNRFKKINWYENIIRNRDLI